MEAFNEFALLVAVMLPVGVVALLNVLLALSGERGTLLLPSLKAERAHGVANAEPESSEERAGHEVAGIDLRKAA